MEEEIIWDIPYIPNSTEEVVEKDLIENIKEFILNLTK